MYKYLVFDIEAIEHLKIGKFERDEGNESAHDYITGSAIRGALIWKWVKKYGEVEKEWFDGSIRAYNAYPLVGDDIAIPMPNCYGGEKKMMKSKNPSKPIHNFMHYDKAENEIPYRGGTYVVIKGEKAVPYKPKMVDHLHINKKIQDKKNDLKMFRYEAISKGEKFRTSIRVPEKRVADIRDLLESEIFYIGGSRGSGYGRCRVTNIQVTDKQGIPSIQKEEKTKASKSGNNEIFVYFLTDGILYYDGCVNTAIPTDIMKEKLGIEGAIQLKNQYVTMTTATTYNAMYKTNTVCYSAIAKGSILKYELDEEITRESILAFEEEGIGLRKEDGFGQIKFLLSMPTDLIVTDAVESKKNVDKPSKLEKEEEDLIYYMAQATYEYRRKLKIDRHVLDIINHSRNHKMPTSQLGKILYMLENRDSIKESNELELYLDHMKEKKGLDAWQKLAKIPIQLSTEIQGSSTLQQLLYDHATNRKNDLLKKVQASMESVEIGDYVYPRQNAQEIVSRETQQLFLFEAVRVLLRTKGGRL